MAPRNDIDWREPTYEAAAEWVVRLHSSVPEADAESDWLAFETWLDAAPGNRAAYDAAESLWSETGRQASALRQGLAAPSRSVVLDFSARRHSAAPVWWAAGAAAAAAALLFVGPFSLFHAQAPTIYATAKGERRTVTLADGSSIALNGGSRISVLVDSRMRRIELAEGSEAAFRVVHDPSRPFVVQAGDRVVRDIGTEFDILRDAGALKVTVREGEVEVAPNAGAVGQTVALTRDRQLNHREGSANADISEVSADDAFGWRQGRLVYRGRPLGEVAQDLTRYYGEPVRVTGAASALRFSGVLEASSETAAIKHLSALVPVSAKTQDGVIILQQR